MPSSLSLLNMYAFSSPLLSTSPASLSRSSFLFACTRLHYQETSFSFKLLHSSPHDHPDHPKHPNQTDQPDHSDNQEDKCRICIVYFVFSKFHMSQDSLSRLHFCATNICSTIREQQFNVVLLKE